MPLTLTRRNGRLTLVEVETGIEVCVDFVNGAQGYRHARSGTRKEAIARAAGVTGRFQPSILDCTAGLGRDAFLLATLGCEVTALERNETIHALLEDGLARARQASQSADAAARIALLSCDAHSYLAEMTKGSVEVIYIDPMYGNSQRRAAPKKELRLLQELLAESADSNDLLPSALHSAGKRVIAKRHARAEALEGPSPDHVIAGSSTRFDVYMVR